MFTFSWFFEFRASSQSTIHLLCLVMYIVCESKIEAHSDHTTNATGLWQTWLTFRQIISTAIKFSKQLFRKQKEHHWQWIHFVISSFVRMNNAKKYKKCEKMRNPINAKNAKFYQCEEMRTNAKKCEIQSIMKNAWMLKEEWKNGWWCLITVSSWKLCTCWMEP